MMRIITLVCACALAILASESGLAALARAQETSGMSGGPPAAGGASLRAAERDPAAQSARSIECSQKADARGLQGKIRKHFLHQCKSGG